MKKLSIFLLSIFLLTAAGCWQPNTTQKDYTTLAKCLTEKGVKMYGAVWCSHCQNQKKKFGEAFQYITYIECDPKTDLESAKLCVDAKIEGYPTWRFSDGTEVTGEQDVEQLGLRVGCEVEDETLPEVK